MEAELTLANLRSRDECPLCHHRKASIFMPFEIPVVQCCACGFLYSDMVLSERDLQLYYENNFGGQRHMQGQLVNATVNSAIMRRLVDFQKINRVLDVGTGYGFLLKRLKGHWGLDVAGVELSRQEADYARSQLKLNVINSFLGDSGLAKGSYDLVTSFEVIEHVSEPIEFIRELGDYVRRDGYLLIMTDNFESCMAKSLGASFPKWIPHAHISHFASGTLRKAIEDTGRFEITRAVSYTPWEILARNLYYRIRGINKTPSQAFNLATALSTEMGGGYRFFLARRFFNRIWANATLSDRMDGDLMYFLCKKI